MTPPDQALECLPVKPQALGLALASSAVIALALIRHGRIVFANPAFVATFGHPGSLIGMPVADLLAGSHADGLAEALGTAESRPVRHFGIGRRRDGRGFDVELGLESVVLEGEPVLIAFAWDITEKQHSNQRLSYLAFTDTLTGLANRAMFADRLHQALVPARRLGGVFAVLMADLDGFKSVNDTYGHETGDIALQIVGQRFQGCIRADDTLARIGGDEFAVLLPRLGDRQAATLVAQRMIAALAAPLDFGVSPISVGTSIGIAAWPEHAGSADALLAAADTAMYRAKRAGKNRFEWATGPAVEGLHSLQRAAWSAAHAIGIQEIDEQHLQLAGMIDQLALALRNDADKDAVLAELSELVRYTALHFATEERLMETHQVADLARHREEHQRLLHDIRNLQLDSALPSISLILRYLQEWLLRHVDGLDKQLGHALIARGCR